MLHVIPELVDVAGQVKVRLTIRKGGPDGPVLDADLVNPYRAAERRRAAVRLADRVGEPHAADRIERAILQCVEMITDARSPAGGDDATGSPDDATTTTTTTTTTPDAGPMTVVRPELILVDGLVAVSVPEVVARDGEAVGRWRLYLRLPPAEADGADGPARACRTLTPRLDHPGAGVGTLWLHPVPSAPSPATAAGWSAAARRNWLARRADADDHADDPVATFDQLCAALAEFLDVDAASEERKTRMEDGDWKMEEDVGSRGLPPSSILHPPSSCLTSTPHPLIATLALWTMLTYLYVAWDAVPYLFVTGPAGSGKTRVFELLARLVFRPIVSSNLSAPALFRTLHDRGGTLLLDEAERLNDGGEDVAELRSILLAGYKRGGRASRLESAGGGESYRMSEFQVFGPKAIACINAIPPALASRCIPVQMFRSPPGSQTSKRRIDADPARWQRLRDALHETVALGPLGVAASTSLPARADLCPLGGRPYELWQPLLAIAAWIDAERERRRGRKRGGGGGTSTDAPGEAVYEPLHPRLLGYARRLCERASEGLLPEEDFLLLWTLAEKAVRGDEPTCRAILEVARRADPDALRGVSARKVADILKRYGLHTTRTVGRSVYRDVLAQLRAVEARYDVDLNTAGRDNVQFMRGRLY